MYKQKQYSCCCPKRKYKCAKHGDSCKKKRQILQTYLVSPYKIRQNAMYELLQKEKLQALQRKNQDKYIVINPNTKYYRSVKTQNSDLQDKYIDELESVKKQIKNLKKDLEKSRTIQVEPIQYEQKEITSPVSKKYLTPIKSAYPSRLMNPQLTNSNIFIVKQPRRGRSVNYFYEKEMQDLSDEVKNLRKQIITHEVNTLQRQLALQKINSSSQAFPLINQNYGKHKRPNNEEIYPKSYNSSKKLDSLSVVNPKSRIYKNKPVLQNSGLRKFRKAVNAVFFCSYLRQFSEKVRHKREQFFKETYKENIYYHIALIKSSFINSTVQVAQQLPLSQSKSLIITASDNEKQRQVKIQLTRKYLNIFLDAIGEVQFDPNMIKTLTQTCYYVCRHGGAGITSNYFTSQELDIMCVSKAHLRICAQKHLQKSQIISFIWVKLIIFNILLRTSSVQQLSLQNNALWNTNFYLIGSIIYQISHNLQAQLIQRTPINYIIGNWKHINFLSSKNVHSKKQIIPCKSMVVVSKPFEKVIKTKQDPNELIQGTISKSYLSQAYEFEKWQAQERKISNFVNFIHKKICKFHSHLIQDLV